MKLIYFFTIVNSGGIAGGQNRANAICVLPLNMLNQKYFSFLYVWMGVLVILTLLNLTIRVLMVVLPDFRTIVLNTFYGIKIKKSNRIHKSSHGDWLLMSYMVSNMNPLVGAQFLDYMDPNCEISVD